MIDPTKITNYNLTQNQLEEHLLFWVFAAGHNAQSTAKGIDKFLTKIKGANEEIEMIEEDIHIRFIQRFGKVENFVHSITPFEHICKCANYLDWKWIENKLGDSGLGCWRRKSRTVRELCLHALNLKTCSIENLESIWGIGPKTARCFLMHSRKGMRVAGLDTHVLKFLGTKGIAVPKSTPTGKRYKVLEEAFLKLCDEVGKEPAEYDLEIWNKYAKTT